MGMLLFIASEVMFFAALFGGLLQRQGHGPAVWPPEGTEFIDPVGAADHRDDHPRAASSFTMQWGIWRIRKGDRKGMNRAVAVTLLLGVIFLCSRRTTTTRW